MGFQASRRDVNDQSADITTGAGLEPIRQEIDVLIIVELRPWVQFPKCKSVKGCEPSAIDF
jgi:hypothetical protein